MATVRYRRHSEVAFVGGSDRLVAMNLSDPQGPPILLDGPAAAIWEALDDSTVEDLAARVAAPLGVAPESVHEDVAEFVSDLVRRGMASEVHGGD